MLDETEKNNLLSVSANSTGPIKGEKAPNLLRNLLTQSIPFHLDVSHWIYCYYTCGMTADQIHKLTNIRFKISDIKKLIKDKLS